MDLKMPLLFKYPVKRGEVDPVLDRPNRSPVYMKSVRTGVKKKKKGSPLLILIFKDFLLVENCK